MQAPNTKGIVPILIAIGSIIILLIWMSYEAIDFFFVDHSIKVLKPIIPEIEIIVEDNIIDTLYVYRKP